MREKTPMGQGIVVEVINGDIERALRKFKKRVQNSGIFQELKNRECFVKPSELRRREKAQALSRARKRSFLEENTSKDSKLDRYES
jgi:ribosomal protein S21